MARPERIVSLVPSLTETLIALGCRERLVGITRFCIHPAEAVAGLETVGGTKDPDLERIRALAPDVVFMNSEENRKEDHEALASSLDVDVSEPRTVAEIPGHLRHLGARVGAEAKAETLAAELEAAIARLEAAHAHHPELAFSYAYVVWRKPWMATGPDTYVDDLLTRAGGRNVFADASERYPSFELEALAARAPGLVLLADEPFPFGPQHIPEVAAALPNARVELVSGDDACWHGVRSLRGVAWAERLLARAARSGDEAW
jgi:iron complex transport system substrate-binding protein